MSIISRIEGRLEYVLKNLLCIRRIEYTEEVYLTFDDGPEPGITEWVLDELKKYDAKATFFCVGKTIQKNENLYMQILAEGHAVASHTMNHSKGHDTGLKDYCNEVSDFISRYNTKLFRPPYESLTIRQLLRIKRHGVKIILWSHDSTDWYHDTNAPYNIESILTNFSPGSIILFHSCKKHETRTKEILPKVLEEIKKRGMVCGAITPKHINE